MQEKNTERITIRLPSRWKTELQRRKIRFAPVIRSAIWKMLETSDQVLKERAKEKSKEIASRLYFSLNEFFVRTKSPNFDESIRKMDFKTPLFRAEYLPKAQPEELAVLAQFLAQEEYAEEILNEVYHDE